MVLMMRDITDSCKKARAALGELSKSGANSSRTRRRAQLRGRIAASFQWVMDRVGGWLASGVDRRTESPCPAEAGSLDRADEYRERLAQEYSRGYQAGWRECFGTCLQAIEDEIASADEIWRIGAVLTNSGTSQQDN